MVYSALADLQLTASGKPNPVKAGTNLTYTVNLKNLGPKAAQAVNLTDALPANTTFKSFTAPLGWVCTKPAVGSSGTVHCTKTNLANGGTASFRLVVKVNPATPAATILTNVPIVSSGTSDPVSTNNSATITTNVVAQANLKIVKTGVVNTAKRLITYTLTINNLGPSVAGGVQVTDTLPVSTTLQNVTTTVGSCTSGLTVTCNLGTLAPGAKVVIKMRVQVAKGVKKVTNTAWVSSPTPDPVTSNNHSTLSSSLTTAWYEEGGRWLVWWRDGGGTRLFALLRLMPAWTACQHRLLPLLHQAHEQGALQTADDLARTLDARQKSVKRDPTVLRVSGQNVHTRGHREK